MIAPKYVATLKNTMYLIITTGNTYVKNVAKSKIIGKKSQSNQLLFESEICLFLLPKLKIRRCRSTVFLKVKFRRTFLKKRFTFTYMQRTT